MYDSTSLTNQHMRRITFRPCIPEDVHEAIPLIFESGPLAFDYVFKNKRVASTDFLKFAFQRKGGEFSFDNHIALLVNKKLVGIGAVFSGEKSNDFMFRDFINIVRFYKMGAWVVVARGLRIEQIIRPPQKHEVCLAHIAIAKQERSKGLGQKLLQFLMTHAEISPSEYFVLDVSEENPKAQGMYERLGFKVYEHMRSHLKNKNGQVANHFRMQLR